jgi:hypothetical protein
MRPALSCTAAFCWGRAERNSAYAFHERHPCCIMTCLSCHHSKKTSDLEPRWAKNVQLLLLRCTFLTHRSHRSAYPDGMLPAYHRHMDPDSCSPASQRCSGWLQGRTSTPHWLRVSMSLGELMLIHRCCYGMQNWQQRVLTEKITMKQYCVNNNCLKLLQLSVWN